MEIKTKNSLTTKMQYAFCVLSATYFITRSIASWYFNI
jgi:hypothetical protein